MKTKNKTEYELIPTGRISVIGSVCLAAGTFGALIFAFSNQYKIAFSLLIISNFFVYYYLNYLADILKK